MKMQNLKKNYKTIIGVSLLAFLLWFIVKINKSYDYALDIPIRYTNLDSDRVFKHPRSGSVRIEFTGKGKDLLRLPFYDMYYQIDLSGAPRHLELNLAEHPEFVSYPGELDVSVKSVIQPRLLTINLDKKVQEKLPVQVAYNLQTPPGYILVNVKTQPESVLVIGPAELFQNIDSVTTEKAHFEGVGQAFTEKFTLRKPGDYYVKYQPPKIEVRFDIQRLAEKEVPGVPVDVINTPPDLQVIALPSNATIYVKGGEKVLANLDAEDFEIVIDFQKVRYQNREKVKADLVTDAGILYMETRPPEFELIVQKGKSD